MGLEHVENPRDWALGTCESHCAASRAIPACSEPQHPKIIKKKVSNKAVFLSETHSEHCWTGQYGEKNNFSLNQIIFLF